jgi:hypothetical protein
MKHSTRYLPVQTTCEINLVNQKGIPGKRVLATSRALYSCCSERYSLLIKRNLKIGVSNNCCSKINFLEIIFMNSEKLICVNRRHTPIRKLYCTLLKRAGYETVDFEEGKPAIEWLSVNPQEHIIWTSSMPDMNGTDLYYQMRQLKFIRQLRL